MYSHRLNLCREFTIYSLDRLAIHLKEVWEKGVRAVIFFGVPDHKDACGSGAYDRMDSYPACLENDKETLSGNDLYCGYLPLRIH